jgi:hypothetical protein
MRALACASIPSFRPLAFPPKGALRFIAQPPGGGFVMLIERSAKHEIAVRIIPTRNACPSQFLSRLAWKITSTHIEVKHEILWH